MSCSVANETDRTFSEACADADNTLDDKSRVDPAVALSALAAASSSVDDDDTACTTSATVVSNESASARVSALRCSTLRRSISFSESSSCSMRISFSLNVCAARALSPTSSRRSV